MDGRDMKHDGRAGTTARSALFPDGPLEVEAVVARAHACQQAFDAFAGQ
jgi:hypothetical protein